MGYGYSAYAVDLKKLKPSKNADLFEELLEEYEEDFADNFESFSEEIIEGGAPILQRALWELLRGKPSHKEHGFQYGYALEVLCKHFGERVGKEELTWFDDRLDPLLKKARCPNAAQLLGKGILPMTMPAPNDFPEIGTVTPAGCIAGLGALVTVRALVKPGDGVTMMVVDEVRGWFEAAKRKKSGLVTFIY